MTTGQISRRASNLVLALGFGITFVAGPFLFIAAPGSLQPMFGVGADIPAGVIVLGGWLGMLVGFALMLRIWRQARDPEPERFRTWRYRSR